MRIGDRNKILPVVRGRDGLKVSWKGSSTVLDPDGGLGHGAVVGVAVEVQGG